MNTELLKGTSKRRLIDDLPYAEYREDNRLFIMKDRSLGVIYRVPLLEHEALLVEDIADQKTQLEQWMKLPSNCTAQILYLQRGIGVDEIPERVKLSEKPECSVAELLREGRIEMLKARQEAEGDLFQRDCYFAIRFQADDGLFSIRELLPEGLEDSLVRGLSRYEARVQEFEKILSRIESLSRIKLTRVDAEGLREILSASLGNGIQVAASINPGVPLDEQLIFDGIEADQRGLCGDRVTRTVSLLVPSDHYEGGAAAFLRLKFPYTLSLRMTYPTKAKVAKILALKEWCTKNSYSAKSQRQFQELQETKKRLAEGDQCVHLCWSVTVEGTNAEEAIERANRVAALAIENFDCNAIIEEEIGFDLYRSSLPLLYDPKSEWGTQRHIPLHLSEIVDFIPIFDSFRGTKVPLQVFTSREGNLVPLSATEGETCQHGIFLGDSGSGKSALINNVINGIKALNPEPIVFVIDFNTSQVMNVKFYGGELNVFNHEESCPASVFRGVYDNKKISVITNWVCEAVRLTSSTFEIESEHKEAISQAVKRAYKKKALAAGLAFVDGDFLEFRSSTPIAVDMDGIAAELAYLPGEESFEKFRGPIEDLLVKLRNFYGDGIYSHYFKAAGSQVFDKRFYVYDLVKIQDDPVLLNLTVAAIFEEIRQLKLRPENQEREIWAILDEIAVLGRKSDLLTQYFVNKAETSRKDAFWIFGATNRPQNFFDIAVCLALFQVAEHFFFLPMDKDNVRLLAEKSEKLNVADKENIGSLRIERDAFSEAYYLSKSKGTKGVIRYHQTPHEKWQSPTNARAAREAIKTLKQFGGDAVAAIRDLVTRLPGGVS